MWTTGTILFWVVSVAVILHPISSRYMPCPAGWSTYTGSRYCYHASQKSAIKWKEARKACLSMGGDLVKITSAKENTYVAYLALTYAPSKYNIVWLGLVRDAQKNFTWLDGSGLSGQYSNWNKGEPNSLAEGCGMMYLHNTKWNDGSCDYVAGMTYVCQKQKEECCMPR